MSTDVPPPAAAAPTSTEDKTVAILSYITIIGFIIALVMHNGKKTQLGGFHLRQMLGIILTGVAAGIIGVIPFIGWILFFPLWIFLIVLWVMGLISAINGQFKPVPLLGAKYQTWFAGAFA